MKRPQFILFPDEAAWTVAVIGDGSRVSAPLEKIPQTLRSLGHVPGQAVLIALPSVWCLSATLDIANLSRSDRKAMIFRLEELIPLAAEDVTADIVPQSGGNKAMGVCVQTRRLAHAIAMLESENIPVESVVPAALLAAQSAIRGNEDAIVILESNGSSDVVAVERGRPIGWGWTGTNEADVKFEVDRLSALSNKMPVKRLDKSSMELGITGASRILSGRSRPWVNLRRDALAPPDPIRRHRTPLNLVLAAAACLFLCITLASFIQARRYERAAQQAEAKMVELFHERFPDWNVPANIRDVIDSERRKRAAGGDARGANSSVLFTMRNVMALMPADEKLAIDTMGFDSSAFELSGKAREQNDIETLASGARSQGFDIAPPQMRMDGANGRWSFTVSGSKVAPKEGASQ